MKFQEKLNYNYSVIKIKFNQLNQKYQDNSNVISVSIYIQQISPFTIFFFLNFLNKHVGDSKQTPKISHQKLLFWDLIKFITIMRVAFLRLKIFIYSSLKINYLSIHMWDLITWNQVINTRRSVAAFPKCFSKSMMRKRNKNLHWLNLFLLPHT